MTPQEELETLRRLADLETRAQAFKQENREAIGSAMMGGGKQVLRGAGDAAVMVLERGGLGLGGGMDPSGYSQISPRPAPNALSSALRAYLDKNLPSEPGVGNAALRGLGGGAPNPRVMIPGMAAGGASEAVKEFGPAAQIGAGMLAGGMTGYAFGPRARVTPDDNARRDTGILSNIAMDRIGPKTSGLDAANMVEDAATAYFKDARGNRTDMFSSVIGGEKVSKRDLANIYLAARRSAEAINKTGRGEQADAIMEAANKLVTGDGRTFINDLQQLSLSLKSLKENPPALSASTGKQIDSNEIAGAVKALESALESVAPALGRANKVYQTASRQMDVASTGPLGRLADKTPFNADPAPLGKLDAVVGGSDPRQIVQTMAALKSSGADPSAIARALVEKKLGTGPMRPSERVFGGPGSQAEEQLSTLIASGGRDVGQVRAPLDAADKIAANLAGKQGSIGETVSAGPSGVAARLFAKPNAIHRIYEKNRIEADISKIIQNASPQEIEQLMKLSMFDPKLRMAFTLMGMGRPMMSPMEER